MKRLSFYSFLCAVLLMSVNVFGQQFSGGGSGTLADPYRVANASQFNEIANHPNAFFVQTTDITFNNNNSTKFTQIDFDGIYDGQGHKIISSSDQTKSLFGTVTGTITRVTVEMGAKTVKNVGAILCYYLDGGTISYCNIKGNVEVAAGAGTKAGGIVNTMASGLVEYCCFQGKVKAKANQAYVGGICAMQNGGEIKGSMVASVSELTGESKNSVVSGIANGSNSPSQAQVTSCYSQATFKGKTTTTADIASGSGVIIANSYPNATGGLSGQTLANYLNNGLDPVAFGVDNGNVVSVASTLSVSSYNDGRGIFVSKQNGNFDVVPTWKYTASDSDIKQFIISAGNTVTLQNANDIQVASSIIVRDGGNFINTTASDVTATMEKNITANQWNFIGFPVRDNAANGYGVAPLAAVEGDIWALRYDYQNNTWDNTYLHWYEGSQDYVKAGNGIFAYPDNDYTLSIEGTLNNAPVTVENPITPSENGNNTARWMALANPYPAEINIASLINLTQGVRHGDVVYLYNGTTFTTPSTGTIEAGQGFFVNMEGQNNSFTFTTAMINNSTAKSVSAEREFVRVSVSTDGYKVPVLFAQNDDATDGYDIYDANKMFGNGTVAEPYLICEGIELCKEEVLSSSYTATMNVKSSESRSVEIVADNIPEGYSLTLIDGALEVVMNQGDVYTTDITEGENADRFKLLITKNNVSIADVAEAESIRVVNNNRSIRVYGGKSVRTEVYNALGQKVYETSDRAFDLNNVASGAYILKVSDGKTVNSAKIVVE
ncbi:MAG: T9SS type A sorting domain-containing protein [Bacteroidales bacterium]|nr:T9SS type A sorting domain-containing protein [Bacteroidales bacterium]MDD5976784.1 T9SS type A sorting domain-containing protein [Bacteroidales bacterium]MDD6613060.1 T9SS type A sorting domain-containing protein [Bacteroidales bacterium]